MAEKWQNKLWALDKAKEILSFTPFYTNNDKEFWLVIDALYDILNVKKLRKRIRKIEEVFVRKEGVWELRLLMFLDFEEVQIEAEEYQKLKLDSPLPKLIEYWAKIVRVR